MRRVWSIVLVLGLGFLLTGGISLFMTVHYTPEELMTIIATNPKWFMDPSWLHPSPASIRKVCALMMFAGLVLATIAMANRID
jgi:hypothetical protein